MQNMFTLLSGFILGAKLLAVVNHTEPMRKFSLRLSTLECSYESSLQLLLLFHIWLSGGVLRFGTALSSLVVIGKVLKKLNLQKFHSYTVINRSARRTT